MRMGFLVLLILMLCTSLCVAGASMDKPWYWEGWLRTNPNIYYGYGLAYWWNIDAFDATLDGLDAGSVRELDISSDAAAEKADAAYMQRLAASDHKYRCLQELDDEGIRDMLVADGVLAASGTIGAFAALSDVWNRITSCADYAIYWKGTMDNSVDAMVLTMSEADKAVSEARYEYGNMQKRGMCDSEYHGAGREVCRNATSAFMTVDSGRTEGDFGGYVVALESYDAMKTYVREPLPGMRGYPEIMTAVWGSGGVMESFGNLKADSIAAIQASEAEYDMLERNASAKKAIAWERYSGLLEDCELYRIDEAPKKSTVGASESGAVDERLMQAHADLEAADLDYKIAEGHRNNHGEPSYLRMATEGMRDLDGRFDSIDAELDSIEMDAKEVVKGRREEAAGLIGEMKTMVEASPQSTILLGRYEAAVAYFERGEDADESLGAKFEYYGDASAEARSALSGLQLSEQADVNGIISEVGDLLERAKADDIQVYYEEETFAILKAQSDIPGRYGMLEDVRDRIVANAKAKYGHLEIMRMGLIERITLIGPAAADLLTEMDEAEGDVSFNADGTIRYAQSIGHLKALESDYLEIGMETERHAALLVANSMDADAYPLVGTARLDEPAEITLDILLKNMHEYGADEVEARVTLPVKMQLLYSDIVSGADGVESVRMEEGGKTLIIVLERVEPYQTFHPVFRKQMVIAHTKRINRHALGRGDGTALVEETIRFELDMDVNSIGLAGLVADATIDGYGPGRPLASGEHTLEYSRIEWDAYDERIENVQAYEIGMNTEVSYDIVIDPSISLDETMVYIDIPNDSRVSDVSVYSVNGDDIEADGRISGSAYLARVFDLDSGMESRLKVIYNVENVAAFVNDQLDALESGEHSESVDSIISEAESLAAAGDYDGAMASIERANAAIRKEGQEDAKLKQKFYAIRMEIVEELAQIEAALDMAGELGVDDAFVARLGARKDELLLRLDEADEKNASEALEIADEVDIKWMDKEITAAIKQMYAKYNDLRERFAAAGNMSTPQEFIDFETEMNRLEVGRRPEYVVSTAHYLGKVMGVVETQEGLAAQESSTLASSFASLKENVLGVLQDYMREKDAAKGTSLSGLFSYTEKSVKDSIDDVGELIGKSDNRLVESGMLSSLHDLKLMAGSKLELANGMLAQKNGTLSDEEREAFSRKIHAIAGLISSGEYVNAIRAGDNILDELGGAGEDGNSMLVLGITALAILATVAVYILQHQGEFGLKKDKTLRKLEKAEENRGPEKPHGS